RPGPNRGWADGHGHHAGPARGRRCTPRARRRRPSDRDHRRARADGRRAPVAARARVRSAVARYAGDVGRAIRGRSGLLGRHAAARTRVPRRREYRRTAGLLPGTGTGRARNLPRSGRADRGRDPREPVRACDARRAPGMPAAARREPAAPRPARRSSNALTADEVRRGATKSGWGGVLALLTEVAVGGGSESQTALLYELLDPFAGRLLAAVIG